MRFSCLLDGDGGDALQGKHVDVFPGDAAEALQPIVGGAAVRIVAVLSATRLGDALKGIPTAREQGVEIVWPTVRGVYVRANVPRRRGNGRQRFRRRWPRSSTRRCGPGIGYIRFH